MGHSLRQAWLQLSNKIFKPLNLTQHRCSCFLLDRTTLCSVEKVVVWMGRGGRGPGVEVVGSRVKGLGAGCSITAGQCTECTPAPCLFFRGRNDESCVLLPQPSSTSDGACGRQHDALPPHTRAGGLGAVLVQDGREGHAGRGAAVPVHMLWEDLPR